MVAIESVINEYLYLAIEYFVFVVHKNIYICRVHKVNLHLVQMILN